jgi:hypothetical protein
VFDALEDAGCVETDEDGRVEPTTSGRVASYYYLNYRTMLVFASQLREDMGVRDLLDVSFFFFQRSSLLSKARRSGVLECC